MKFSKQKRTLTNPKKVKLAQISLMDDTQEENKPKREKSQPISSSFDPYEGLDADLLGFDPNAVFENTHTRSSIFSDI